MDKYTFGNTKAAIILVEILDRHNDEKESARISRFMMQFGEGLNSINEIKNARVKCNIQQVWKREFLNRIDLLKGIQPETVTYVKNVIISFLRRSYKYE